MDIQQLPLIGEHPVLDFINTVDDPGTESEVDYLPEYELFAQLCLRAGLIAAPVRDRLVEQALRHPIVARRAFRGAIALRENLRGLFLSMLAAGTADQTAIKPLNILLSEAYDQRDLEIRGDITAAWQWKANSPALRIPLWEIALRAADLLCDEERMRRLKVCANDPCQWLFLDYSRNGQRRWCSMAECGNVAKVRRLRARRRSKHQ